MLRRIAAAALAAVCCALLLCGCGETADSGGGKLKIVATIFPAYDFAREVFGDSAEVTLLLKPGTESHSYDPAARDIVTINSCDLFIYNGGESDAWVENILKGSGNINTLRMMDLVDVLGEERSEGMTGGGEDDEYDEHVWTSPENAAKIVEGIAREACGVSPENAQSFRSRADDYIGKINALDKRFEELLAGEERYFVFGDRFPLLYFFREYGLNYYAAFPGCGAETEPSAQNIAFLSQKLSDGDTVKTVFYIELSNHRLADALAAENGLPTAEFHACHNITADDFEAGESWVSLMERNYAAVKNALEL